MTPHPLHSLFNPQHIAVIGASERAGSLGEAVFTALGVSFNGRLSPVSLRHSRIGGYDALPQPAKLSPPPDLAVIACPADGYETAVKACIKAGIPNAVVLFAESSDEASFRKNKIGSLTQGRLNIVCCTREGFGLPNLPLHTAFRPNAPQGGKTALICHHEGLTDNILSLLAPLGTGFSHYFALSPASPVDGSRLLAGLNEDTQVHTLVVQLAPEQATAELFAALRLAARRKNIILYGSLHTDTVSRKIFAHAAERCGCLAVFTPEELAAAVRTAVWPKKYRSAHWQILGTAEHAWLPQHLSSEQLPVSAAGILPPHLSTQTLARAVLDILNDENSRALLVCPPEQAAARAMLNKLQQQTDKALAVLSPAADGLYGFADGHAFRHTLLAQNSWQNLKKAQQHSPRPWQTESPVPDTAAAQKLLHRSEKLAAALQLPPQGAADGIRLQYRTHEHYGACLIASGDNAPAFLPPFQSSHAKRLAEWADDKKSQAGWERLLRLLNRLCQDFPELQSADFVYRNQQWQSQNLKTVRQAGSRCLLLFPQAESRLFLHNGTALLVRPIEAEDADALQEFVRNLPESARKNRFMLAGKELPAGLLAQFCQPVRPLETVVAAFDSEGIIHGLAQTSALRFPDGCEFGIIVSEALQGRGLASFMMKEIIAKARLQGYRNISADILADNRPMLKLAAKLGFTVKPSAHDNTLCTADMPLKTEKKAAISEKLPAFAEKIPAMLKRP